MIKQCIQCSAEFEANRDSAKFCGSNCRVAYNRAHSDEETVPVIEVVKDEVVAEQVSEPTKKVTSNSSPEDKANSKWGDVCTLEEWKRYPTMCENKAQMKALNELYDSFTAKELVDAGICPPKWKQFYGTYAEAVASLHEDMENLGLAINHSGYWTTPEKGVNKGKIDYSTWK